MGDNSLMKYSAVREQSSRIVVALLALTMPTLAVVAPAQAADVAPAPTAIVVSQDELVMKATITVGDAQTVGTVTVQVGSGTPQTITRADSNGDYNKTLTLADAGSSVVFRATAISTIGGKPVASEYSTSQPVIFRRAQPATQISVTQDDLTLSVAVTFAPGTMLSSLAMKVGGGSYSSVCDVNQGENCGDGPYDVDMNASQIGKSVIFRVVTGPTRDPIPDSIQLFSDPFTLAQSLQPTAIALSQDGYIIHIDPTVGVGQSVGDVTVFTYSGPEGQPVEPVGGKYAYEIGPDDINHGVRVAVTAQTPGQVISTAKSATIVPGIAGSPTLSTVKQFSTAANVNFTIPAGTTIVITATVDGEDRPVSITQGVARIALTADDADRLVQFYAHGTKPFMPDSDEVVSEDYVVVGAEIPVGVLLSQTDASLCAQTQLNPNQTIGVVQAKVNEVSRTVSIVGGKRCITLTRADAGQEVIFSVSARAAGQVDSGLLDSDPYLVQVATKPKVTVSQKGKVISVAIKVAAGQKPGVTTYVKGKGKAVVLKSIKGKYSFKVTSADVGKKIIVKTFATGSGYVPSVTVSSAAWTIRK